MNRAMQPSIWALISAVRFATLEMKLGRLVRALEWRYRPDQPRAPAGTAEGGQWIDDFFIANQQELAGSERVRVAAGPKCDGYSGGCQMGGTYGTTGMFKISGMNLCRECAVKYFSLEDMTGAEQMRYLMRLDPEYRFRGK
jgi:hypothetical protein